MACPANQRGCIVNASRETLLAGKVSFAEPPLMTDEIMALRGLMEKSADAWT